MKKYKLPKKEADRRRLAVAQLKKAMADISAPCGDKDHHRARNQKERAKYGFSYCDSYGAYHSLGLIMSNALYSYATYADMRIMREDFALIRKHAKAIREYAEADSWDSIGPNENCKGKERAERIALNKAFAAKEKAWKEAMAWLTKEFHSLWW